MVFLPLLFYYFSNQYQDSLTQTAIPIITWHPNLAKRYPDIFVGQYPPERNYQEIYLTGDEETDHIKLAFSKTRIREILQQNDVVNGIHYHFGDDVIYSTFINALDILRTQGAKKYIIHGSDIWFLNDPPKPESEMSVSLSCGRVYVPTAINQKETQLWKDLKNYLGETFKNGWQVLLAYAMLAITAIFWTLKQGSNARNMLHRDSSVQECDASKAQ